MFSKTIVVGHVALTVVLGSAALLSQRAPAPSSSPAGLEFPVIMRQNVAAGTTPIGTKVQAKLLVATLVDGVVVPRGAILSGEVTESVKKSKTDPSRLAIRMDSAQWKNGAAPIKVYLTAWFLSRGDHEASGSLVRATGCRTEREKLEWNGRLPRQECPSGFAALSQP